MAAIVGIGLGSLLGLMASGLFTEQSRQYTSEYNNQVEIISSVIQKAMQTTNQATLINQRISFLNSNIECGGALLITNQNNIKSYAMGSFDTKAAATLSNDISNKLTESIVNSDKITTGFLSQPLPSNTTEAMIKRNISQVVRQTFTSENLNSMTQSVQVNQVIDMQYSTFKSSGPCVIGNFSTSTLLAQNAMKVVSDALFTNHLTNEFMNSIKNSYDAVSKGIFSPIEGFFDVMRWGVLAIVVIVIIVVIIGGLLKLFAMKTGTAVPSSPDLRQLLLLNTFTSSTKKQAPPPKTV